MDIGVPFPGDKVAGVLRQPLTTILGQGYACMEQDFYTPMCLHCVMLTKHKNNLISYLYLLLYTCQKCLYVRKAYIPVLYENNLGDIS